MKHQLARLFCLLAVVLGYFFSAAKIQAVCPVCTVAVGAGLGISRWLGIDDIITALWVGGLATSSGMYVATWLDKSRFTAPFFKLLATFSLHILLIPTLYILKIAGNPLNSLWGVDKMLLGIVIGSVVFYLSVLTDRYLKAINNDQVIVYYQKVILPMLFLSMISFIFYFIV